MIRQTCEQTNVWVVPTAEQVSSGDAAMDTIREAIDQLCAAAEYWPAPQQPMTGALEG